MKKIVIVILVSFLVCGCEFKKINIVDRNEIINSVLYKDFKLYNRVSRGYKYYLPVGAVLSDYKDYNETILAENCTYYLYVDIISYYNKKNTIKKDTTDSYYYKKLNYNNKTGYILITEYKDKYLIEYQYNYGKIETLVKENQINNALINISYILSTIQYNDASIESIVGNNILDFKEEHFEIESPTNNEQSFDVYVETYDKYNDTDNTEIEE